VGCSITGGHDNTSRNHHHRFRQRLGAVAVESLCVARSDDRLVGFFASTFPSFEFLGPSNALPVLFVSVAQSRATWEVGRIGKRDNGSCGCDEDKVGIYACIARLQNLDQPWSRGRLYSLDPSPFVRRLGAGRMRSDNGTSLALVFMPSSSVHAAAIAASRSHSFPSGSGAASSSRASSTRRRLAVGLGLVLRGFFGLDLDESLALR
jgi:hypothetical protein